MKQHNCHNRGQRDASVVLTNSWPKCHCQDRARDAQGNRDENPADSFLGDDPQYRRGNVNEERVPVDAHDLQKRVGNDVHHFAVSPHEETPESEGDQPGVGVDDCGRNGHFSEFRHIMVRFLSQMD